MDVKILHFKCQRVVRSAFEDFKHYIQNSIFDVDDSIIEIELNQMKQTIGIKMNSWFYDCNYSEKQYEYMKNVINYYQDNEINSALGFVSKYKCY
jgi:hypothetical protein